LNILSKENNKLREENEELKERLRGLGITDFDVM
jgi:regulator of replication initiation timing